MILLYCFDLDERVRIHGYFRDRGIRLEATAPSDFRTRSYLFGTEAILVAGRIPSGFLCELNPEIPVITIGKYPIGDSIAFRDYRDPRLLEILSSFSESDASFDHNGILYSNGKTVIYLGYVLDLTDTERAILSLLVSESERDVSVNELAEICIGETHARNATVTKHVSSINAKAKRIGGRTVIYSPTDHYYRLKKYI